jgi:hypothetical protein
MKGSSVEEISPQAQWLALGARRARALATIEQKEAGAIDAAGASAGQRAAAEMGGADNAGGQGQPESQAQAATSTVALEPEEHVTEQVTEQQLAQADGQRMEARAAVAAQPHKRQAVSAATAVGAVGDGGRLVPGEATEIADDTLARGGGRVERRGARGARRRLAPYARDE